jgi:hypothetical protein
MEKNFITVVVSIMILLCTIIVSYAFYNVNDRNNMAKNIESAIQKGIDPLSVKCAYETNINAICITYAATVRK